MFAAPEIVNAEMTRLSLKSTTKAGLVKRNGRYGLGMPVENRGKWVQGSWRF